MIIKSIKSSYHYNQKKYLYVALKFLYIHFKIDLWTLNYISDT